MTICEHFKKGMCVIFSRLFSSWLSCSLSPFHPLLFSQSITSSGYNLHNNLTVEYCTRNITVRVT